MTYDTEHTGVDDQHRKASPRVATAATGRSGSSTPSLDPVQLWSPAVAAEQFRYLTERRNAGATPDEITDELIGNGWDADSAAQVALRSLRRRDHHRLLYWTLTFAAGFGALGTASALHLALQGNPAPIALASWITLAVVAVPLAGVTAHFARRTETSDRHAIWSPTRRALFGTLAGITGVIGIGRLLTYVFEAVAALVGVKGYELTVTSFLQVVVSLAVSIPLFSWSLVEWRRSNVLVRSLQGDREAATGSTTGRG